MVVSSLESELSPVDAERRLSQNEKPPLVDEKRLLEGIYDPQNLWMEA